ncbi:MAG: membrane integrity-associated transporter subunit PqiC [Steroidobacteraceae bacterium]
MSGGRLVAMGTLILLCAACTSAPVHFHTLIPVSVNANSAPPSSSAYSVNIEAVKIPAQVDRVEMVVRQNSGEIAVLNTELWIAPLPDELQGAMSGEIHRQLGFADVAAARDGAKEISIRVVVERFESAPSRYALIDAWWELRTGTAAHPVRLRCSAHVYQPVGKGYTALERGQQRAVAMIADQIATAVSRLNAENSTACPMT